MRVCFLAYKTLRQVVGRAWWKDHILAGWAAKEKAAADNDLGGRFIKGSRTSSAASLAGP